MTNRPFVLMVDAASEEEPPNRHFGTLDAALRAFDELDSKWHPFVWILETTDSVNLVHVRDGQRVSGIAA